MERIKKEALHGSYISAGAPWTVIGKLCPQRSSPEPSVAWFGGQWVEPCCHYSCLLLLQSPCESSQAWASSISHVPLESCIRTTWAQHGPSTPTPVSTIPGWKSPWICRGGLCCLLEPLVLNLLRISSVHPDSCASSVSFHKTWLLPLCSSFDRKQMW